MAMKYNAGFTLLELIMVVALTAMISVGVTHSFVTTLRGSNHATQLSYVKEEGDYAITTFERAIRNSKSVITCTPSMSELRVQDFSIPPNTFRYFLMAGRLRIDETIAGVTTTRTLTSDRVTISNLAFNCIRAGARSGDVVTISFAIRGPGITNETFSTKVMLRNFY